LLYQLSYVGVLRSKFYYPKLERLPSLYFAGAAFALAPLFDLPYFVPVNRLGAHATSMTISQRNKPKHPLKLKVQVWIYRKTGDGPVEVLLLKLNPERGSYWQPVTGGVEPGEKVEDAALREAREETGLDFKAKPQALDYVFRFYSPRQERECEEHVFALQARAGKVTLDPHEHVESRWVLASEAEKELRHPSNAEGLRRLSLNFGVR
jgi:dATP pyrophosphohydrolase